MNSYKLTNRDISIDHRQKEYYLFHSDFNAAFAYWVVSQSPYLIPAVDEALIAFSEYIEQFIPDNKVPTLFNYDQLDAILTEANLEKLPAVAVLNERRNGREGMGFCSAYDQPSPDDDFIDLGALARNIFFMLLRNQIVEGA
jgi:hypothetical protein